MNGQPSAEPPDIFVLFCSSQGQLAVATSASLAKTIGKISRNLNPSRKSSQTLF